MEEKGIDFDTAVPADNRVGNVLVWEKVHESK